MVITVHLKYSLDAVAFYDISMCRLSILITKSFSYEPSKNNSLNTLLVVPCTRQLAEFSVWYARNV